MGQIGIILPLLAALAAAADWPRFRGPNGSGISSATNVPVEFGADKNVAWKTPLPPGHSSPILAADGIFLTGHENDRLLTLALDRRSGKILWRAALTRTRTTKHHANNNAASPSPATDGRNVYVFFQDFGLVSYDPAGKERWKLPLGPFQNYHGMGSSPILIDNSVILVCDQDVGSFLIAVDKETGVVRWRQDRREDVVGNSFVTPVILGSGTVIVPGSGALVAYHAANGEKLWWRSAMPPQAKASPVVAGETLYLSQQAFGDERGMGGDFPFPKLLAMLDHNKDGRLTRDDFMTTQPAFNEPFTQVDSNGDGILTEQEWLRYGDVANVENTLMAFRPEGRGDLTTAQPLWRLKKGVPNVPSPILYQGIFYVLKEGGILTALDPATGEILKQGRLTGALDKYFASPVAAGGKLYMASEAGHVAVVKSGRDWELLAVHDLGEPIFATPPPDEGRLYVRTRGALYCFANARSQSDARSR